MDPMRTTRAATARGASTPAGPPAARARRRAASVALVAAVALAVSACGNDPEPEVIGAPIVLSGSPANDDATASGTPSPAPTASAQTGGAAPVVAVVRDDDAEVDVDDQRGDGTTVLVREVRLPTTDGHVVVIDPRSRAVLGSAPVRAGTTRAVTIDLTTPVQAGGELVALLYADDGDGRFDPTTDAGVVDDDGDAVDEEFEFTVG